MKQPEYTIAVISDLLDISPQTIRLYEHNGIIRAHKNENNGYRFFNRVHLNALAWARSCRAMGFSMEDTAKLLNDCDLDGALALYQRREEEMEREIRLAKIKKQLLSQRSATIRKAQQHLGEISFQDSPDCYLCPLMNNDQMVQSGVQKACARAWSRYLPFVWPVGMMAKDRLYDLEDMGEDMWMIRAQYARLLGFSLSPGAQYLPARRCVHTFFTRQSQTNQPFWRNLTYVFDFLRKEGLEVNGNILVEPLLLLKRSTERLLYAQAFFPID